MDDNTLEQRIRYLVEHGGLYDDPLADIRWLAKLAIVLALIDTGLIAALHF